MPIGYSAEPTGVGDRLYRWLATKTSRFAPDVEADLLPAAIDGFRRAQRFAYDCVAAVRAEVVPGMTEREAAGRLAAYCAQHGHERYLHRPFAWFGEHSRFQPYRRYDEYHPSDRRLEPTESVILDIAPIVDGFTADIGLTFSLEPNPEMEAAKRFLLDLRAALPPMFESDMRPRDIWAEVDAMIAASPFDNVHERYPYCVLGHRVFSVPRSAAKARRIGGGSVGWFSVEANMQFLKTGFSTALSPENVGPKLGLWAIEPHIGFAGGGAKFEEILILDHQGARWLDDDVPHVREADRKE